MTLASSSVETLETTEIVASSQDLTTHSDTIKSGEGVLVRGTVLARETASGHLVPAEKGGAGGIGNASKILTHDIDATSEAITCPVYSGGGFDSNLLTWDASFSTDADKLTAFDAKPINLVFR
ncbi:head decoration protein [Marinicellulosiphila megalodicopiae]|uniref:head decoration protein n=1 Tax=Marinicellulosiphila megalodicopiae TaxID=2724896 RepID=UPI003BAF381D